MTDDLCARSRDRGRAVPGARLAAALLLAAGLAGMPAAAPAGATAGAGASAPAEPRCEAVVVPLTLPASGATVSVRGTLCGAGGRGLQILLAGGTYGRGYWDFPYRPELYSYVRQMSSAGWATLALDRLGTGASDHPPSGEVTIDAHVEATHQVVRAARAGRLGGKAFRRVYTVGNSMGAHIALLEAARHGDVDGVISTANLSSVRHGAPAVLASLYPAQAEAQFVDRPAGYLTTRPGTRGDLFYVRSQAEAVTIAVDEATKETFTDAELRGLLDGSDQRELANVRAPILSVVGEFDNIFCPTSCAGPGGPAEAERDVFPHAACFRTHVVAGAGHVLNLHTSAPEWYAVARQWLERIDQGSGGSPAC